MARVWQAVHVGQGVPVALKIIAPDMLRDPHIAAALRNEVRAVASLDHPGIVWVYDHGEVDGAASRASGGALREGSAWLAIEFASGGSLARIRRPLRWAALRDVALSLLDALAHAHARGVVHLDLKPGNVLVCTEEDARPGLKISDFGIAHAFGWREGAGSFEWSTGTPAYMAPEQVRGSWRDYGPWTDLYGLGCLLYRLATGGLPFGELEGRAQVQAHLERELPALPALEGYPPGAAAWLARLCRRDRHARFSCAADAAWGLLCLGEPDEAGALAPGDLSAVGTSDLASAILGDVGPLARRRGRDASHPPAVAPSAAPPMPADWRHPELHTRPAGLRGAGLALYGLRGVPMVGRERERDALWGVLREVHERGEPRVAYLFGPAGNGKSRLAGWLVRRATELGAASALLAAHGPLGGPAYGLRRMLANQFRTVRLPAERAHARVVDELAALGEADTGLADALTEILAPTPRGAVPRVRLETPAQRFAVVLRYVRLLARTRPVVLCLEDVHWASEVLELARRLMDDPSHRVLVLMTARDSELAERPATAELVDALSELPGALRLRVGPLGAASRRELVQGLLGLEGTLAAHVEERTGGNPLFAVQLVGHWVQRGLLVSEPGGFSLRGAPQDAMPADLHEVWSLRVERALEGLPEGARVALELAAALGSSVDEDEWVALCADRCADSVRTAVKERLAASRLLVTVDGGWHFAHAMLRESVERVARREGRWRAHHRECAAMVRRSGGGVGVAERLGRHLVEAGQLEDAIAPLLVGVRERKRSAGVREALSLLRTCEDAMHALRLPAEDARWGEVHVRRGELGGIQGDLDEADRWCGIALDAAERHGWRAVAVRARIERAEVALVRRDLVAARLALEPALAGARALGEPGLEGRSLQGLGRVASMSWDEAAARQLIDEAISCYTRAADEVAVADCWRNLAGLEQAEGRDDVARALMMRAMEVYQAHGRRHGVASCVNELAELARLSGQLDAAEQGYRRALEMLATLGVARATIPELNLAMVLLARGCFDEARALVVHSRSQLERHAWRPLLGASHVMLACCAAAREDWADWDHQLGKARELLRETGFADPDVAWTAERAGELCADAGRALQAVQAYRVALAQRLLMGDEPGAERLRGLLARMV